MTGGGKKLAPRINGAALKIAAHELYDCAQKVNSRVPDILSRSPVKDLAYAIKARAKRPERIIAKIREKRMRPDKPNYNPSDITDVAGVRIVTLFQNDIPAVVKILLDMHDRKSEFAEYPFAVNGLREIIIYSSRPDDDPLSVMPAVQRIVHQAGYRGKLGDPQHPESGYSSVHMVFDVDVNLNNRRMLPIEIQIRDLFEEAWGEIDHRLRYKPDGTRLENEDPQVSQWLRNLNSLKTHCDGCSQHAWIIKERPLTDRERISPSDDKKQAETTQEAIRSLKEALTGDNLHELVQAAYSLRARADLNSDALARAELFGQTEAAFDALIAAAEHQLDRKLSTGRSVGYHLALERAFCQYSRAQSASVDAAIDAYRKLLPDNANDPVIHYRLGTALLIKGEGSAGVAMLEEAITLFDRAQLLVRSGNDIPQRHWMRSAIPRNTGYAKWALSRITANAVQRKSLLFDAIEKTKLARRAAMVSAIREEKKKALNNLCWYLWEYLVLAPKGKSGKISIPILERTLREFLEVEPIPACASVGRLETICSVSQLLEKYDLAVKAASRGMTVLHERALRRSNKSKIAPEEVAELLSPSERATFFGFLGAYEKHPGGIARALLGNIS